MGKKWPDPLDLDTYADVILRLKKPVGRVDMVLDTDTYNEIDDQYAIAYMLASQDQLDVQAILAAPFLNHHSRSPEDGMRRSFDEIFRVLSLTGHQDLGARVFPGATRFLADEATPSDSPAARELVSLALAHTREHPLYVVCIAACTNVSSALLLEPSIRERMVVVWSGGVGLGWPDCDCFNGGQDVAASRVLMQSGVPLVLAPGRGVADHFLTTGPELEYWLRGRNPFCDYIVDRTIDEARICYGGKVWSRPIFDVVPVAWLLDGDFLLDRMEPRPTIEYGLYYSFDQRRPMMRYVYSIKRDNLMNDLFAKIGGIDELRCAAAAPVNL